MVPHAPTTVAARPTAAIRGLSAAHVLSAPRPPSRKANDDISANSGLSEEAPRVRLASLATDLPLPDTIVPLSLEEAINLGLQRNLELAAVRASEPIAEASLLVAETYPWNPQFQTQVAPYSRDRDGNDAAVAQQHVLVQTFELGGQRRYRIGATVANWEQVNGTIRQAELLNVAQTMRLFFSAVYQRQLRDMVQTLADLNEELVGVIERREKAGQASNADVELARLQAKSSRRQQRLAEAGYQTAIMKLRNHLYLDAASPLELAGHWVDWRWRTFDDVVGDDLGYWSAGNASDAPEPEREEGSSWNSSEDDATLRRLVAERPDVVAARAAVAVASENLRLANAMRRPNLQIGPMWQRDEASTEFWAVQAQLDIPVVNTGESLVAQRTAELRQLQIVASQLESRAVLEARGALQRYERARRLVDQSRNEFPRSISDALKPFEGQFRAGQITLLEVFAARAALAQSRQSFLDLLNELAQAVADVTEATGVPPQLLLSSVEPLPAPFQEDRLP